VGRGRCMGAFEFCGPCVFGCISIVVTETACVRDCRGLGLCTVGTVG
jgi:hypothetical protein